MTNNTDANYRDTIRMQDDRAGRSVVLQPTGEGSFNVRCGSVDAGEVWPQGDGFASHCDLYRGGNNSKGETHATLAEAAKFVADTDAKIRFRKRF